MTYRIKVPPRSLPVDEAHLVSSLEHKLVDLQKYRWSLLVGLLLLLIVGGIIGAVLWYDEQTTGKAQALEREATMHYLTRPANDPKKVEMNLKEAVTLYKKVVDEYPRTPSAPLALFGLGNALIETNQLDGAIEAYQRLLSTYGSNTFLTSLAHQKLGYAYLLKGDREQAGKSYSAILHNPVSLNRDQALFELARLDESQSRFDEALKRYQEISKTFPSSPFASEAALREKILDARKSLETTPAPAAAQTAPSTPTKK